LYYVIGAGPTAISCARALVQAGKEVTLLDAGLQLEPQRQESVRTLAASDPSHWDRQSTAFLREGVSTGKGGIPLKLLFGSDYPYREPAGATCIVREGVDAKPSYALGGLSTVWGSAVMPYRQEDISDWPISVDDLAPGYRAVLQSMPLSARKDDLNNFFPLYCEPSNSLPMSRQAVAMLSDLERNRSALNARGVFFGSSRLAVRAMPSDEGPGCAQCGLCMYGCPRKLIYASDQSLAVLQQTGLLHYRPGLTVEVVEESAAGVTIHAVEASGNRTTFNGERAFLAAGLLNTTAILLRSLGAYDTPLRIRDSQYFLLPILRMRGTDKVTREGLHTLAQLFIEIFDESISPHTIHLQTYTYSDLFLDRVVHALGPLRSLFPMETFLGRLMLFQGYLHSSHSSSISATLERTASGDALRLKAVPNSETSRLVGKLTRKLIKLSTQTGVVPLPPLLEMGMAGRGYHSGGSFPMSADPGAGESDWLGRPHSMQRVHAVDATVLPSIPATTITFSAMANAFRIGHAVAKEGAAQ